LVVLASSTVGAEQAQLGGARARIKTAERALERERRLAARGISARRSVEEAEQELAAARAEAGAAAAALGVAGSVMSEAGRYALTAPFKGSVVARAVAPGKTVAAGETLIEVADIGVIWAELDIPEAQAGDVRRGQPVRITLEGTAAPRGEALVGTIARVGARVQPNTRTVSARIELPNPGGRLKAGTFIRAVVTIGEPHEGLVVPRESIQRTQGAALVFVKKSDTVYRPVPVEVGSAVGDAVEVVSVDLAPGAEVVTTGAFLLKTEILKESIGAGCCEVGGDEDK
jgi:cobalt-zinc-cadmium efflux system membrane fusion protein